MKKLIDLMLEHDSAFVLALLKRSHTSRAFKAAHVALARAIEYKDVPRIETILRLETYFPAFKRVVMCLPLDFQDKQEILEALHV